MCVVFDVLQQCAIHRSAFIAKIMLRTCGWWVSQAQSVTQALENAKWTSWSGLGETSPMEAMRLYVRTLEEDVVRADIWSLSSCWRQVDNVNPASYCSILWFVSQACRAHDRIVEVRYEASTSARPLRYMAIWLSASKLPSFRAGVEVAGQPCTNHSTSAVIGQSWSLPAVHHTRARELTLRRAVQWHTQPKWQTLAAEAPPDGAGQPGTTADGAVDEAAADEDKQRPRTLAEWCEAGSWTAPAVGGERRPLPRYDHAVAGVGLKMFVVGGNNGAHGPLFCSNTASWHGPPALISQAPYGTHRKRQDTLDVCSDADRL